MDGVLLGNRTDSDPALTVRLAVPRRRARLPGDLAGGVDRARRLRAGRGGGRGGRRAAVGVLRSRRPGQGRPEASRRPPTNSTARAAAARPTRRAHARPAAGRRPGSGHRGPGRRQRGRAHRPGHRPGADRLHRPGGRGLARPAAHRPGHRAGREPVGTGPADPGRAGQLPGRVGTLPRLPLAAGALPRLADGPRLRAGGLRGRRGARRPRRGAAGDRRARRAHQGAAGADLRPDEPRGPPLSRLPADRGRPRSPSPWTGSGAPCCPTSTRTGSAGCSPRPGTAS